MKIRVVKTASNAKAVQVVQYQNNKRKVIKHFGSAHSEDSLNELMVMAEEYIKDFSGQLSVFADANPNNLLLINQCEFIGVKYRFFYQQICAILEEIKLTQIHGLVRDLAIIRLFEPASKLRSLDLMEQYLGLQYSRKNYYNIAPKCLDLKKTVTELVVNFAKKAYEFNFDLLFYDVTTLYFETFEEDELRKNGFSKDGKSQQPQILVALLVSKEGFPVGYEIFEGNTFEGHTIIPVIKNFIESNQVKDFTVVADAAMISTDNVKKLVENGINYIVGARLGNIASTLLDEIDKNIIREDGKSIRLKTDNGDLICSYSSVRYRKDLFEMNKQIEKAKQLVENPSKGKKLKYTSNKEQKMELNEALIDKSKKLLGIKGYYTNLAESKANNSTIIARYHELYRIEHAFRIAKSDLQTRPIFHFKADPIKLHILICFI